jgi:hypothetical protein
LGKIIVDPYSSVADYNQAKADDLITMSMGIIWIQPRQIRKRRRRSSPTLKRKAIAGRSDEQWRCQND